MIDLCLLGLCKYAVQCSHKDKNRLVCAVVQQSMIVLQKRDDVDFN